MSLLRPARIALPLALLPLAAPAGAQQQVHFSVDWKSPVVGTPDAGLAFPITEGDLLAPTAPAIGLGPLPGPTIAFTAGFGPIPGLGLNGHPGCAGHPGGTPCIVEVDGLSYGVDFAPLPGVVYANALRFSTDEFALGLPAAFPPNVATEGPIGEVATDVLVDAGLGVLPTPPFAAVTPGAVAFLDGDGLPAPSAFQYPGIGLREPRLPVVTLPATGDNLDALEIWPGGSAGTPPPLGFFFSLDAPWPDPLTGIPHSGSAPAHGFSGADVLNTPVPGAGPVMYAPAPALGLDLVAGPFSDDLDALVLTENGIPGYQPSVQPFDWATGGTDMLLFSVRRGSAVIGMPDSIFGIPIEEGDVLTTPLPTALGGLSPFPGLFVAAENLGLSTARSAGVLFGDDLDALDSELKPTLDCNGNGVEDAIDIATGFAADANGNGIPDSCEGGVTYSCFCPAPTAPCGNNDPSAGCANSTSVGALLTASGSTSVMADDLVMTTTQMPINTLGIMYMGTFLGGPTPFVDGLRCVGGNTRRWPLKSSGATGSFSYGPGMAAYAMSNFPPGFWLSPGSIWHFQSWYRDPAGPCATGSNLSNAATATFTP
jgi:hypothetical protein